MKKLLLLLAIASFSSLLCSSEATSLSESDDEHKLLQVMATKSRLEDTRPDQDDDAVSSDELSEELLVREAPRSSSEVPPVDLPKKKRGGTFSRIRLRSPRGSNEGSPSVSKSGGGLRAV